MLVTGGAGFIGSHLVDKLMSEGGQVVVVDNFSSGSLRNVERWLGSPRFKVIASDLKVESLELREHFRDVEAVFHFAANPEVRISAAEPRVHFNENLVATFNVLETMRRRDVPWMVFASSSTVYGEPKTIPTPESYPTEPISVYGTVKLAAEELIKTYVRLYGLHALILRYANIIGSRSTHGVIVDFIRKLRENPSVLEILGDGTQRKSYMHISDAIDATVHLYLWALKEKASCEVFNVGSEDWVTVVEIADIVSGAMGLKPKYVFKPMTPDGRGWPGDVKFMLLDVSKLKSTGWIPQLNSRRAVEKAVGELLKEV